jgi:hypothetical protein
MAFAISVEVAQVNTLSDSWIESVVQAEANQPSDKSDPYDP